MPTPERAVILVPERGVDPLALLAGLPIVLRLVLSLERYGITDVEVWAERSAAEVEAVLSDRRVRSRPRVRTPESFGESHLRDAAWFVTTSVAFEATHLADLAAAGVPAGALGVSFQSATKGPVLGAAGLFEELGRSNGDGAAVLARLVKSGAIASLPSRPVADLDDAKGRELATNALFEACRKPVDGLVARALNRSVSIAISKRLVGIRVTPNQITCLTFALGMAAAVLAVRGSYAAMLLAAALLQANSILDGVDGELARVRFEHSRLGEWLDTVSDDVSNLAFYVGLSLGTGPGALSVAGFSAALAVALTMVFNYPELLRKGSGDFCALGWQDPPRPGFLGKVVGVGALLLKKDFFILLYLGMALVGLLPWALAVAVFGHTLAFAAALARSVGRLVRRPITS